MYRKLVEGFQNVLRRVIFWRELFSTICILCRGSWTSHNIYSSASLVWPLSSFVVGRKLRQLFKRCLAGLEPKRRYRSYVSSSHFCRGRYNNSLKRGSDYVISIAAEFRKFIGVHFRLPEIAWNVGESIPYWVCRFTCSEAYRLP